MGAPDFDPTAEQLFPRGVVADIEKSLGKSSKDGIIGTKFMIYYLILFKDNCTFKRTFYFRT